MYMTYILGHIFFNLCRSDGMVPEIRIRCQSLVAEGHRTRVGVCLV